MYLNDDHYTVRNLAVTFFLKPNQPAGAITRSFALICVTQDRANSLHAFIDGTIRAVASVSMTAQPRRQIVSTSESTSSSSGMYKSSEPMVPVRTT